jgi:hypothetical protein
MPSKYKQTSTIFLPFPPSPNARASLRSGTVYAIDGGDSYIYYGQIAPNKSVGFFKYRSKQLSLAEEVLSSEIMSRFGVGYQSIGQALRAGTWLKIGIYPLRKKLEEEPLLVQWPVGTLQVDIWEGHTVVKSTMVHDPDIQNLEIIAAYDAVYHVPKRLQADFTGGISSWPVGGPIWRERIKKEELARNHPEQSWHTLPKEWVPVERKN